MNNQVKAAVSAVRDFISGHSAEAKVADSDDKELRRQVAAELLASMRPATENSQQETSPQAQGPTGTTKDVAEIQRSRQLFMENGYFDEAVQDLRGGQSAADRAAAARALGLVGSQRATAHLIAAMFDDEAEVRNAAGEALNQIGDPKVSNPPLTEMLMPEAAPTVEAPGISVQDVDPSSIWTNEISTTNADGVAVVETVPEADSPESETQEMSATGVELQVEQLPPPAIVTDAAPANQEEQLLLEEHAVRGTVERYERQLMESAGLRHKAENEARWRAEREAKIRANAEARRVEGELVRQRLEEETAHRRAAETEALASEHAARQQAETEMHRLTEQESLLRLETGKLRHAAEELARQRRQKETARREAAEAARLAEATRVRLEAEKLNQTEVERFQNEEQGLRFALEETAKRRSELEASRHNSEAEVLYLMEECSQLVAAADVQIRQLNEERDQLLSAGVARRTEAERLRREAEEGKRSQEELLRRQIDSLTKVTSEIAAHRAEIERSREKAEQDAEQLVEALARMQAAYDERARAEQERLQVEAATNERVEAEQRLLDEARRRASEEQARLEEEKRRHDETEEQRMAMLEDVHRKTESEAKQRAEKEKQILSVIDHIRIADADVRRRIEEAETLRRASERAYRLAAEKVQRIEAEAHAAALQEGRILEKLEAVRRNVAAEAQARAAQEKRIKDEIEEFRLLHDEERPRLEAAILQRTAAAARLQQMRESRPEASSRPEGHQMAGAFVRSDGAGVNGQTETSDNESTTTSLEAEGPSAAHQQPESAMDHDLPALEGAATVQPAVGVYLKSVDPYRRAAAVAELARSQGKEAFGLITDCFDDPSPHVRNAAARAMCQLEPARTVDFFNRALEEGSEERRRNIGAAIAGSGLATEAIDKLASDSREDTYNALSILFVMAKTGEVEPLVRATVQHSNEEVSRAVVKLLTLSGQAELAEAAMKKRHGA